MDLKRILAADGEQSGGRKKLENLEERVQALEQRHRSGETGETVDRTELRSRIKTIEERLLDEDWVREQLKSIAIEEKVDKTLIEEAVSDSEIVLQDEIAALNEQLETLQDTVSDINTLKIEDYVQQAELEGEIDELRDRLTDRSWIEKRLQQLELAEIIDTAELEDRIEDVIESRQPAGDLEDVQADLDTIISTLKDHASDISKLENYVSQLDTKITQLESRDTGTQDAADQEAVSQLRSEIAGLKEDITALDEERDRLHNRIGELESMEASAGGQASDGLQNELAEVRETVDAMQDRASSHASAADLEELRQEILKLSDLVLEVLDDKDAT